MESRRGFDWCAVIATQGRSARAGAGGHIHSTNDGKKELIVSFSRKTKSRHLQQTGRVFNIADGNPVIAKVRKVVDAEVRSRLILARDAAMAAFDKAILA